MPRPPSPSRARLRAACSRHLAVPTGIPRERAISATGRSSTWCRTRIIRSFGRRRSNARAIASLSTNSSIAVRARGSCGGSGPGVGSSGYAGRTDTSRSRPRCRRAINAAFATIRLSQPSKAAGSRRRGSCRQADDERVLGRVGGVGIVGEDRPGEAVAAIDPGIDEHLERRRVAGASAPNERVVGRRRRVRAVVTASTSPSGRRS